MNILFDRNFSRFAMFVFLIALSAACAPTARSQHTQGREVKPLTSQFIPGDYTWKPEISPAGPVVMIVSIPEQKMYVFRNGVRIGRSGVSTGKPGKATPTGVFTILQRKVDHTSSIYKGAKMPHMQRLTWSGIAIHAGNLPGYPASAGCVRLPVSFARKLYSVTSLGTTVIITDHKFAPGHTSNPGALLSGATGASPRAPLPPGDMEWEPAKAPNGPVSVIFSTTDRHAYLYRNGVQIGRAGFNLGYRVTGTHVYSALATIDANGRRDWLSTTSVGETGAPDLKVLSGRLSIAPAFLAHVRSVISPGSTLIVTDLPVSLQTQSGRGFDILSTAATP